MQDAGQTLETRSAPKNSKWKYMLLGLAAGILNGLFGAGGGVIVVPLLEKFGLDAKRAHATSIAVIFPLSLLSAALYLWRGDLQFTEAFGYIPGGLIGAAGGALLLKKISNDWLRRIFGAIIILSAVRILLR
ncbi:MAG TPA: sulfite exporter TauE/SafE family protein [Firmicutes bacterium]|nr:sulfite exporter TauE/SafE family protein [Bacillota bacterium]